MKYEDVYSDELVAREERNIKRTCICTGQTTWDGQKPYSGNVDRLG